MDVSIIVTAYNYAPFVDECLDSCLNQIDTHLEYEVIVVDDGSTDETPVLLAQRSHPSLHVLRIENSGIEVASNQGFAAARGRYIVRVDADDALEPDYLFRMAPLLENDFGFCYGDYTVIDGDSRVQEVVYLPAFRAAEVLSRGDFLATGTLYPSAILKRHGGYSTLARNSGLENYELIINLIAEGARGLHVAAPVFRYRRHKTNLSTQRIDNIVAYGRALFESMGLGPFRTNENHPYNLVLPRTLL